MNSLQAHIVAPERIVVVKIQAAVVHDGMRPGIANSVEQCITQQDGAPGDGIQR